MNVKMTLVTKTGFVLTYQEVFIVIVLRAILVMDFFSVKVNIAFPCLHRLYTNENDSHRCE